MKDDKTMVHSASCCEENTRLRQENEQLRRRIRDLESQLISKTSTGVASSSRAVVQKAESLSPAPGSSKTPIHSGKISDSYILPLTIFGSGHKDSPLELLDSDPEVEASSDVPISLLTTGRRKRKRLQDTSLEASSGIQTEGKKRAIRSSPTNSFTQLPDELPAHDSHRPQASRAPVGDPNWMYEDLTEEEAKAALRALFNPKAKIKEELLLPTNTILNRLSIIGLDPFPVTLEERIRDVPASRKLISSIYGGSVQSTLTRVNPAKLALHGYNNFMFLNLMHNPHAPQMPGYPGLFFKTVDAVLGLPMEGDKIVFVRLDEKIWLYLGNYELTAAPSLTQSEWLSQTTAVRNTWAEEIQKAQWGKPTRLRVSLWEQLGREPTPSEVKRAEKARHNYEMVTASQIRAAYDTGQQVMAVYCMKCIGYHEALQRRLARHALGVDLITSAVSPGLP